MANLLPDIEFALNASVQKTTGKSPAEIVFGFKINSAGIFMIFYYLQISPIT